MPTVHHPVPISPRSLALLLSLTIGVLLTGEASAQTNCTPNCTGICANFQSHDCSTATGCTGHTVCNTLTGESCYTFGSQVACTACGMGGYRACSPSGQLGVCRPATPRDEVCNSCDDDADGLVDEGISGPCIQLNGCSGETVCSAGVQQCVWKAGSTKSCLECVSGTMACNSNGTIGTCQPAVSSTEVCNSCDDNKNGVVDDVATTACVMTAGCNGTTKCTNGATTCIETATSKKYGCVECGIGGFQRCLPSGGLSVCRSASIQPSETKCDGCDDNWDGYTDNSSVGGNYSMVAVCQGSQGVCIGSSMACLPGGWAACKTGLETCDGFDNDCDGLIDEDGVCRFDDTSCQCVPVTCAAAGAPKGATVPDGCGGFLKC